MACILSCFGKKEKTSNNHGEEIERLNKENESLKVQLDECKEQQRKSSEQLKDEIAEITSVEPAVSSQLDLFKAKIEELTTRNSELMHMLIQQDGSSIENVNCPSRPSVVVELYSTLTTDHWLAAKEELDSQDGDTAHNEGARSRFLCQLLVGARDEADSVYKKFKMQLGEVLGQPVAAAVPDESGQCSWKPITGSLVAGDVDLEMSLRKAVTNYLKTKSGGVKTDLLIRLVLQNMPSNRYVNHVVKGTKIYGYLQECCRVAWMMVVQQPEMTYSKECEGERPYDDRHDVYFDCRRSNTAVISYFIYPSLMHDQKCLKKGLVYITEPRMGH